jgi:7-carboxy-7-deazaguanine synthase
MPYAIKEVHYTIQGEGANAGRAAVFCRFTGCNLWSGREADRSHAICRFCDTDFVGTDGYGGGHYQTAEDLIEVICSRLPNTSVAKDCLVVFTGGEPLLQLDNRLVAATHRAGLSVAIETNGTRVRPPGIDWVCVSPKAGADLVMQSGDELKFVFPQIGLEPSELVRLNFQHFFLQPMDGPEREKNTKLAMTYCLHNPQWRLSLQLHKMLGIP